jgi:hypothetical protein
MKNGAKIKRLQLKDSQSGNSAIIGIVSSEPDYKLSLAINRKLKISLKNDSPVMISKKPGNDMAFSRFSDSATTPHLCFDLISNRSGKNFLIKEFKNIDFIFQVHNQEDDDSIKIIAATLKNVECVTAIFRFDYASIKDKNLQYIIQ